MKLDLIKLLIFFMVFAAISLLIGAVALLWGAEQKQPDAGQIWKEPVIGMEFVWVPGGCFDMGSQETDKEAYDDEKPFKKVCLEGFWMGKYEVTNGQFKKFDPKHKSHSYQKNSLDADDQPAVYIDWLGGSMFALWLAEQAVWKYEYRFPTEQEWEYACRAGSTFSRFWGDDPDIACKYANTADFNFENMLNVDITEHRCDDGYAVSAPVGSFLPNEFGLYDILGNVWEWTWSKYDYYDYKENKPKISFKSSTEKRSIRGGGWDSPARQVRCCVRTYVPDQTPAAQLGFRLVRIK